MTELSPHELTRLVELAEVNAMHAMYAAAPSAIAHSLGLRAVRVGSACAMMAQRLDMFLFNRLLGLGADEPATERVLDSLLDEFRQAGVAKFGIPLSPYAQPSDLPQWLEKRGFRAADNWVKVYRGSDSPAIVATDLRIEQVDSRHASAFAEILPSSFGYGLPDVIIPWVSALVGAPGWSHYAAFDGERIVATGTLYVQDEVGWLGLGSTLPSHRKRGAQGAIMARRILDAIAQGCRWIVTETWEELPEHPNPSYHNMLRNGFKLAYPRRNYLSPALG